jgi:hypothetical protein
MQQVLDHSAQRRGGAVPPELIGRHRTDPNGGHQLAWDIPIPCYCTKNEATPSAASPVPDEPF